MKRLLYTTGLFFLSLIIISGACGNNKQDAGSEENSTSQQTNEQKNKIHVAHILIMYKGAASSPPAITRSKEEARAEAENVLAKLKSGTDFSELARLYSNCPSSTKGGELSPFEKGDMLQPFEKASLALKKGEISEVVETKVGFHIIKRL